MGTPGRRSANTRGGIHVMIPLGFRPCLQAVPTARAMQYTLTCLRMIYMALMRSSSTWTSVFMVMFYTNVDMHAQQPPTVAWVNPTMAQSWPNMIVGYIAAPGAFPRSPPGSILRPQALPHARASWQSALADVGRADGLYVTIFSPPLGVVLALLYNPTCWYLLKYRVKISMAGCIQPARSLAGCTQPQPSQYPNILLVRPTLRLDSYRSSTTSIQPIITR